MNFGDFICITFILCVGLVERFKFAVKMQVWLSKLHVIATEKMYHVTARYLYAYIRCCKVNLEALSFGLSGRVDRPVGPTRSVLVIHLTTCSDAKPL